MFIYIYIDICKYFVPPSHKGLPVPCRPLQAMDGRHWGTRVRPYIDRTAVMGGKLCGDIPRHSGLKNRPYI